MNWAIFTFLLGDRKVGSGGSHMGGAAGILHIFVIICSRKIKPP